MTKNKKLVFEKDYIALDSGQFVMMEWESELMEKQAKIVTQNGGDILEVGFGMGISAQFIQNFGCDTHTIIESHPQVMDRLRHWAENKPSVRIIEGDWFDLADEIVRTKYDGIFYDADCDRSSEFRKKIVDRCLSDGGIFTYYATTNSDRYKYGDKLKTKRVLITKKIPPNGYHENQLCFCPYFENI